MEVFREVEELLKLILQRNRPAIARAITLCESTNRDHRAMARTLIARCQAQPTKSIRIAITGSPGAGKSTLIEALGMKLVQGGHKVGVLAVDPSSPVTGGSILGDKTRMTLLSASNDAFVRPSPSKGDAGGIARNTREAIAVLEAAGFDIILVETVGVGQGEYVVADIVDILLYVAQPHAGDDLQAIKRGILELIDIVVVNKCDGALESAGSIAKSQFDDALSESRRRLQESRPVLCCSAQTMKNLDQLSKEIFGVEAQQRSNGRFDEKRNRQRTSAFNNEFARGISEVLSLSAKFEIEKELLRRQVEEGKINEIDAAEKLIHLVIKSDFLTS